MTAPGPRQSDVTTVRDEARRHALRNYRRARRFDTPIRAARDERAAAARFVADGVADGQPLDEFGVEFYRAARAIHDAVCQRMALDKPHDESSRREQFWTTGRVAGGAS